MNDIVDRAVFSSLPFSEKIQYVFETSPVYFTLFILSVFIVLYLTFMKFVVKKELRFKMISLRVNQLVLSSILMISSLTGWVAERKFSGKMGLLLFIFSFFFLSLVALMFRSNDRRIDR